MAIGLPLWAVLGVFAIGGLGSGFINPILGAVIYERIPPALLGRVKTLTTAAAWSGIPFGGLVGAALVAARGTDRRAVGGRRLATWWRSWCRGCARSGPDATGPPPKPRYVGHRAESGSLLRNGIVRSARL